MLINSLLSSSESLYKVEKKHIEKIESCDRDLLARIFSVPRTCSYESFYLETGCLPIRFILQGRRLMYFWNILNKPEDELVKKVFLTQMKFPSKNDWILQIEEDIKSLDINLSHGSIKSMKKLAFKKLLKKKMLEKSTEFIFTMKNKENRSKSKNLNSYKLQSYLIK